MEKKHGNTLKKATSTTVLKMYKWKEQVLQDWISHCRQMLRKVREKPAVAYKRSKVTKKRISHGWYCMDGKLLCSK